MPRGKKQLQDQIDNIKYLKSTLIFFESPRRIKNSLKLLSELLGDRQIAVCRELTKMHEEVTRGTLSELRKNFNNRETVKGEITLVIEGFQGNKEVKLANELDNITKRLKSLNKTEISLKDAVKVVSEDFDAPKKEIYKKALEIWDN